MAKVECAGILLTGGRSRRMGRDKATLRVGGGDELVLSERLARILARTCSPAVEIGPGHTSLPASEESPTGAGPLVAVAAGWRALTAAGWSGPAIVLATDLPLLTDAMLRWLAAHNGRGSVVPVAGGRVQPLCARYSPADLDTAGRLAGSGARSMTSLLDSIDAHLAPETEWAPAAGGASVLADVDTPEDLERALPGGGPATGGSGW